MRIATLFVFSSINFRKCFRSCSSLYYKRLACHKLQQSSNRFKKYSEESFSYADYYIIFPGHACCRHNGEKPNLITKCTRIKLLFLVSSINEQA